VLQGLWQGLQGWCLPAQGLQGVQMSDLLKLVEGYKTYSAAIGLLGLAVYQFSNDEVELGIQSLLAALAAFGLRDAIDKKKKPAEPVV